MKNRNAALIFKILKRINTVFNALILILNISESLYHIAFIPLLSYTIPLLLCFISDCKKVFK